MARERNPEDRKKPAGLPADLSRLRQLSARDRWLLAETCLVLAAASLAVRFVRFRNLMKSLGKPVRPTMDDDRAGTEIARIHWAVEACARRLPWRIVCFQKGLAAHHLLKRRGISTFLHYGIDSRSGHQLRAHVWVTSPAGPVIGTEIADQFTCVATFPLAADARP